MFALTQSGIWDGPDMANMYTLQNVSHFSTLIRVNQTSEIRIIFRIAIALKDQKRLQFACAMEFLKATQAFTNFMHEKLVIDDHMHKFLFKTRCK